MAKPSPVEEALALFGVAVRTPVPESDEPQGLHMGEIPEDLRRDDGVTVFALRGRQQIDAQAVLRSKLRADLRFEHLEKEAAENAVWRFACKARFQRHRLVGDFVDEYSREPKQRTCFFAVQFLSVEKETAVFGVRLLPVDAVELPMVSMFDDSPEPVASVVAVPCVGSNDMFMEARARVVAEHALRQLRLGLDNHLHRVQLRFRIGEIAWFEDQDGRWSRAPDRGHRLDLTDEHVAWATKAERAAVTPDSDGEIHDRARRALAWIERGLLASDPITECMFLSFAVEAILGDESGGLKAHNLAVRRAVLSFLTTENQSARHQDVLLGIYAFVRSTAAHGERVEVPVTNMDAKSFAMDVRRAVDQYLAFAQARNLTSRKQVRRALRQDPIYASFVALLKEEGPATWEKFDVRKG
jgi:hypothetical protein